MSGIGGTIGNVAGGLIGMIGQGQRAKKQHERQKELMGIQYENQLGLAEDAHNRQLDIWNKTNYGAQMKHLQDAGLNPALLYGQSGGGGATTGAGNMGQAAGGNAAAPMDIGAAMNAAMLASQIEVNKAQAKKLEADADSTRGGEGTIGEAQIRHIKEMVIKTGNEIEMMGYERSRKLMENELLANEVTFIEENIEEWYKSKLRDLQMNEVEKRAKEMGINLDAEKKRQIEHKIWQDWVNAGSGLLASTSFITNALKNLFKK